MRNTLALAKRILQQFAHDKRTIVLFVLGPILVLWLFSVLLDTGTYHPTIACVDIPDALYQALDDEGATCVRSSDLEHAQRLLETGEVDAVVSLDGREMTIQVEGADPSKTGSVISTVQLAVKTVSASYQGSLQADITITYLHGDESWGSFDYFGPVFIGMFIFVFVFITSGMSLVTERTGGTMERLLVTPIKPVQLVSGFCLGFGVVTIIQASIVLWACISLIGFPNEGPILLVVLVAISMAMVSLTLGLLVSAVAKTPFQVIQFMLVLVIPQVLLSGIFDLSNAPGWMQVLSTCFPITYGAEALRNIMLRGAGLAEAGFDIAMLWGFILVFFMLATLSFRRRKTH